MTKEEYLRMNKGINDQADLPDEFLTQIYDDIAANEIKTKPGNLKRPKLSKIYDTFLVFASQEVGFFTYEC